MPEAYICDYIRTPFGRKDGALSSVRTDDLGALPIKALMERNSSIDWDGLDEVIYGCANQAGEDNRNVARMSLLLAGLPETVPGVTVNRLCGSGMESIIMAARSIKCGEQELIIAGGVESMSRAPFVVPKVNGEYSTESKVFDTTLGWRLVNPLMEKQFGIDSMSQTAENLAGKFSISREDQDRFAFRSQQRAAKAQTSGRLNTEIVPVNIQQDNTEPAIVKKDEHPRPDTSYEKLSQLRSIVKEDGCITAGNASGINDGAAALLIASEKAIEKYGLTPIVKIKAGASAGVEPRLMGYGPVPATQKLLALLGLNIKDIDLFEFNEAFAAQVLSCTRALGLDDGAEYINPNGGAIALGHPLGASGARITGTLALELKTQELKRGVASMCVGVGQGVAIALEAC